MMDRLWNMFGSGQGDKEDDTTEETTASSANLNYEDDDESSGLLKNESDSLLGQNNLPSYNEIASKGEEVLE